ncbi:MAG: hypothetical protein ACREM8_09855 [Vulcanimicrobiaceae bacterium]
MPSYDELVSAWKALRATHAIGLREVACVNAPRTLLLADLGAAGRPLVSICAGVHGDEPASPWALLSIVRDGLLPPDFAYRIWPCTNPSGYRLGTRANADGADINRSFGRGGQTPEARAMITANRDRKFTLSIDMHEDFEADGFYCYEPPVDGTAPFGPAIIQALDDAGLPIQRLTDGFDLGDPRPEPGARVLERGRVLTDSAKAAAHFGPNEPNSLYMLRHGTKRTLTFEAPRTRPWDERIAIHRVAVVSALNFLRDYLRAAGLVGSTVRPAPD